MRAFRSGIRRAFPAAHLLGVIAFLAVASGTILPRLARAERESREATLKDCLRYLRTQILLYGLEHDGAGPGCLDNPAAAADAELFVRQMTGCTDCAGRAGHEIEPVGGLGPYLTGMPENPLNHSAAVLVVNERTMPAPNAARSYGWIYNARTRQIIANSPGTDADGTAYANY